MVPTWEWPDLYIGDCVEAILTVLEGKGSGWVLGYRSRPGNIGGEHGSYRRTQGATRYYATRVLGDGTLGRGEPPVVPFHSRRKEPATSTVATGGDQVPQ